MSWGKGITLLLLSFMAMISYFVYQSFQQDFHLVTENYYEEALKHDEIQTYRSNYKKLNERVAQVQNDSAASLMITLPSQFDSSTIEGSLTLYRPTNENLDQTIDFNQNKLAISTAPLEKGMWHLKLKWKADEKTYLYESSVFLHK